ncbi:bifunctional methylenetetrahydrofolate dehydrogenase/methenyltetrahydrofolate cyclohydrolase FolD [Liquorilactobacillus capillatus]|uniref:Bifunctional protein FolD n=1 Tax=Liquorilactobacillus capillatus DSM 19910 TaxID=1423731 RepID=A0A0R1M078_9LACO|nr:bifunctional methylenetetrahydrofolate dehydrogenase/methenyltetrahydrofolate cyclohydrolase FolD [Liquorilactobacillus capillatus]KRL01319.1 tetrahydrofolate dehydrogenase cyclohydrolase, catalytic domain protein [Liquorilactobacillus capillatus DSM 19910]
MVAKLLDGKKLAMEIRTHLKQRVQELKQKGVTPKLVVILVGNDSASRIYVRNKHRAAQKIGIETKDIELPQEITENELLAYVKKYNEDDSVHGILVQLPLPAQINAEKITHAIAPAKDVDGFHPVNIGHLFMNDPHALPCTPHGIMQFFKKYNISLMGKHAVIVGRSNIVGRPMAAMMLNNDATVTITHSKTKNLSELTRQADILIAAIGQAEFIKKTDVKPGAVVIDVGMNRNDKGKLVGDVDQKEVAEVASYLTPVPGGVGPMTIAMLMEQTVKFAERGVQNVDGEVSNG